MTRVGPWERRSRRIAYGNGWIEVWHDEVIRPDGARGVYGVVHPLSHAVGVVAIDDQGRVALVSQHRYPLDERTWELPEGGVPLEEDPLEGAKRELAEETGATATTWRVLGRFVLQDSFSDERGTLYLATGVTHGDAAPDGTEDIEQRWVSFDDAVAMVADGTIEDAMSQIGLLRAARELER